VLLLSCLASLTSAGRVMGSTSQYLYDGKEENTAVVEYKEGVDFKSSKAPKVVVFYSPYCGHCVNYAPKFMALAKDVTEKYPQVEFYGVSCKSHRDICAEYTIRGYPTVHAWKANSETSEILGKARNSDTELISLLELDKIIVETDRKLVDEVDEAAQEENTETEEDEDADALDGEDKDAEDDSEAQDTKDDEEDGTGKASNAAKASDHETDENASGGNADEAGETAAEGDEEEADSKAEDVEESDGNTNAEEDAPIQISPEDGNDQAAEIGDDDDTDEEVVDMKNMPPPAIDEDNEAGDTEDETDAGDTANDLDAKENDEDEDEANQSEEDDIEEGETQHGAEDETESEENESFEEASPDDRDIGAPRDEKGISEAVDAYRARNKTTSGRRPDAGAEKGRAQIRDMDKWKDLIAEKKKEFEKKKKRLHLGRMKKEKVLGTADKDGATNVMRANTPGTSEYKERMQMLLDKINKFRKKRGLAPITNSAVLTADKSRMPLKKIIKKPAFREQVPIVKRMYKMTEEEQLILDASLSFMAGLKYGVFMTNDSLTAKEKAALKGWLDLLSVSLPPEWGLHTLIDELNDNIDFISQSQANLLKILRKHPLPRRVWSPSCMRRDSPQGFSCGMWKLLHTSTVGIAEQRGGLNLVQSASRIFSPADAADTIREYMAHFFGCIECRNHFIAQYDECSFRRCDRLTDVAQAATPEDWKQLALWLWEVHNDVSVRVGHERIERQRQNVKTSRFRMAKLKSEDQIKHLFPSIEQCLQCFDDDGRFDEDNVFEFLEQVYWSAPDVMADKLLEYHGEEGAGSGFFWFFLIMVFAAVYLIRGRKGDGLQRTVNAALVQGRKMGSSKKRSA